MSDVQGKSFGVQNDPLGQNKKIGLWKKIENAFLGVKFAPQNRYFSVFLKMLKSGHFVLQISPWKLRRQKKLSTPWQSQRKILWNYHLRFFIFETLLQRFFTTKFLNIRKKLIFPFYDKNLWFLRSLKKPSQLLNGLTDFQYQNVKIKRIKAQKFWYIWKLWQKIWQIFFLRFKKFKLLKIFRRIK